MKRIKTIAMPGAQNVASQEKESSNGPKINLIIKSDTLGSGEAIEASLAKLDTMGVKIKILHKGLGNITEGDITRADASNAKLVGFNVQAFPHVEEMARESNVNINIYQIIYELLNDLKAEIQSLVQPDIKRIDLGRIKVLAIFKTDKKEQIIGGKVTLGTIKPNSLIEVMRDNEIIARGRLTQLQSGRQDVDMIEENGECGIKYEGPAVIKINDRLQVYQEEAIYHKVK